MAVKRSQRMKLVLQLAERAEEAAAQQLQLSREQLQEAEQQLQQVTEYQLEYQAQINAKLKPKHVAEMINDREFLQQLGDVEMAQQHKRRQLQQFSEQALKQWQGLYQRRKNIESLIQRLQTSENLILEKQLQKQLDELTSLNRTNSNGFLR